MTRALTIGMAVHNDFDGVYFTVQALRLYQDLEDCELVVVDNAPHTGHGKETRKLIETFVHSSDIPARYIPFTAYNGTAGPRNLIFEVAEGRAVLVLDPHVLLTDIDCIARLKDFYAGVLNPHLSDATFTEDVYPRGMTTGDLFQGPMYFDDISDAHIATHFDPIWREQMYGIWADDPRGQDPNNPSFTIPGMGLGLFTCLKDSWLGFNPHFRGFGGEELYIHGKYEDAGHKTWCLPWLRWLHRFPRPNGVPYPLLRWSKVRNYVLGRMERNKPVDDIYEHFVTSGLMEQDKWAYLVADPVKRKLYPNPRPSGQRPIPVYSGIPLEELYFNVLRQPRDLNEHFPKLRQLASRCQHVSEISERRESIIPLAAAHPKVLISYSMEADPLYDILHVAAAKEGTFERLETNIGFDPMLIDQIEPTDLLFLNFHSGARLSPILTRHAEAVGRYIVLHNTGTYGDKGDNGGAGTKWAMYQFLLEHPDWYIASKTKVQDGLTVLACMPDLDNPFAAGVGQSLKRLLKSIGIINPPGCDCNVKAEAMDDWGVTGCRDNRPQILAWLRDGKTAWGWDDNLTAGLAAIKTGLAFKLLASGTLALNPLNPFPGLVDEAIRLTELAQAS